MTLDDFGCAYRALMRSRPPIGGSVCPCRSGDMVCWYGDCYCTGPSPRPSSPDGAWYVTVRFPTPAGWPKRSYTYTAPAPVTPGAVVAVPATPWNSEGALARAEACSATRPARSEGMGEPRPILRVVPPGELHLHGWPANPGKVE